MRTKIFFRFNSLYNELIQNEVNIPAGSYINIFIDMKGILGYYHSDALKESIVYMDPGEKTDILNSFLMFISMFREYIMKNLEAKVRFLFFYDMGRSEYHNSIDREYKQNRIERLLSLSERAKVAYSDLIYRNFKLFEKISKIIPDVYVISLSRLESDFVPYFLIQEYEFEKDSLNIIHSVDKDMFQILYKYDYNNFVQIKKTRTKEGERVVALTKKTALYELLKSNKMKKMLDSIHDYRYFRYIIEWMLAIGGDKVDYVKNIKKGIAHTKAFESFFVFYRKAYINNIPFDEFNSSIRTFMSNPFDNYDYQDLGGIIKVRIGELTLSFHNDSKHKNVIEVFSAIKNNIELVAKNFGLVSYDLLIENLLSKNSIHIELIKNQIIETYNTNQQNNLSFNHFLEVINSGYLNDLINNPEFDLDTLKGMYVNNIDDVSLLEKERWIKQKRKEEGLKNV